MTAVKSGNMRKAPAKLDCPDCGAPMVLRKTLKHRHADGSARMFYGCSRFPQCATCHGAHPDGSPLGIPADKPTREARMSTHTAFDRLWKTGRMSRKAAYVLMRELMAMTKGEAHIGRFTVAECLRLEERLAEYRLS
jgi:ssDNA-binding Zn-finger/Zn-ribbon topoisomerase 1